MKLTCDLCGGALQINLGGQGATCTNCGLSYTMDRLREKLTGAPPVPPEPPKPEPPMPAPPKPDDEKIYDLDDWDVIPPAPQPNPSFDFLPKQFMMENSSDGNGDLGGIVQQGGIGLGDKVYIDRDYDHPYTVYSINDDPYMTSAKQGMPAELFINISSRQRKLLKTAKVVTGDPNPVANAYNYPGTVKEYFSHLLLSNFREYEIRGDISKDGLNIPVNYLFYKSGNPVLAVFLIDSNDNKARYQVEKAARIFALEGVACTHFYENYRNDASYVIERLLGALPETTDVRLLIPPYEPVFDPVVEPQPEPIILEVKSVKKRPGFAWGQLVCVVRQGVVECGMPYYVHVNTLQGDQVQVGSLSSTDVAVGANVNMLVYCEKSLLPTINTLYVFPDAYDDGEED